MPFQNEEEGINGINFTCRTLVGAYLVFLKQMKHIHRDLNLKFCKNNYLL